MIKTMLIGFVVALLCGGCKGKEKEDERCTDWHYDNAELLFQYEDMKAEKNKVRDKIIVAGDTDALLKLQTEEMQITIRRLALGDKIIDLQDKMKAAKCEGFREGE